MELIETLVNDLSVNQEQAKGGVSLLFQLAKQNLGEGGFLQGRKARSGNGRDAGAGLGQWHCVVCLGRNGFSKRGCDA